MSEKDTPQACPFCGSHELATSLEEWPAYCETDKKNTAKLDEHQCRNCARSFWT